MRFFLFLQEFPPSCVFAAGVMISNLIDYIFIRTDAGLFISFTAIIYYVYCFVYMMD